MAGPDSLQVISAKASTGSGRSSSGLYHRPRASGAVGVYIEVAFEGYLGNLGTGGFTAARCVRQDRWFQRFLEFSPQKIGK